MANSREVGSVNPNEQSGVKPERKPKVIKKSDIGDRLNLQLKDFEVAQSQDLELNLQKAEGEKQSMIDWAADLRAKVKLKQAEEPKDKEEKARRDFDDLFTK
jgi:hypothetical protein